MKNKGLLDNWFHEVKNWDIYEVCESRRLWIEVFGVPPHGWSLKNFERIVSFWEKMICLETPIEDTICFGSMKILIESKTFQNVIGQIILHIGVAGYRITVKEANYSFNINPVFIAPYESTANGTGAVNEGRSPPVIHDAVVASKDDVGLKNGSNVNRRSSANFEDALLASSSPPRNRDSSHGVVGSGTCVGEVARRDDVECIHKLEVASMEAEKVREEGIKSPLIQIKPNVLNEVERLDDSPVASNFCQTRTQTACLSQNGYSEEIVKTTINYGAFKDNGVIEETPMGWTIVDSHDKVFNMGALEAGEVQSQQLDINLVHPPGFEPNLSPSCVNSEETSIPRALKDRLN